MAYRVVGHKWWTADRTRLVDTGDPDAAFLAFPAGTDLAESEARRVGLLAAGPGAVAEPVLTVEPVQPVAEKIRGGRPGNKMAPATPNKSIEETETL
jgi:hypothetical protein